MYKDALFRYGIDDQEDNPVNPPVNLGRDDPGYTSKGVTPTGAVNDPLAQVDTNALADDGESQNGAFRPNIHGALGEITNDGIDPFADIVKLSSFNPVTVAVANVVADSNNQQYSEKSFFEAAQEGVSPVQHIEKINQATQEEKLRKAMADMAGLKPETVSSTGYDNANTAYGNELGNNPQVPELVKPKIGDNQALIGLLATALGGLGVAPEILKGLTDGAQKQADQENQQNQYNYQTQEKQHQQKLRGLEFGVKTAGQKYSNDVEAANRNYVNEYRKRGIEVDDLRADIEHRDKLIQADETARDKDWEDGKEAIIKDREFYANKHGGWDQYGQDMLSRKVLSLAHRHTTTPEDALIEAKKLMAELGIYKVGKQNLAGKKADQAQQRLDDTTKKNLKADLQNYIGIAMKGKDGWTKDHEAEANKWLLLNVPEEDRGEFIIPAPFETQLTYNQRVTASERVRANKAREANQKASLDERKDQNKWMKDYRNDTRINNAQKAILKAKQARYNTNEKAWEDKKSAYDQAVAGGEKSSAELKVMEGDVKRYKGYFDKSVKELSDIAKEFGLEDDNAPKSLSGAVHTANKKLNEFCEDGSPSCAGWASLVLKNTGVDIKMELGANNLINQVLSKGGTRVARNEAQVGDLVYDFGPNRGAKNNRNFVENGVKGGYHVMIYAGNGQVYGSNYGKAGVLKNVASNYVYIRPSRGSAPTTATNDPGYDPDTGLYDPPSSYKKTPPTTQMAPAGTPTKMAPAGKESDEATLKRLNAEIATYPKDKSKWTPIQNSTIGHRNSVIKAIEYKNKQAKTPPTKTAPSTKNKTKSGNGFR